MKKSTTNANIVILLGVVLMIVPFVVANNMDIVGSNLAANSGFETGVLDSVSNWIQRDYIATGETMTATYTWSNTNPNSGSRCVETTVTSYPATNLYSSALWSIPYSSQSVWKASFGLGLNYAVRFRYRSTTTVVFTFTANYDYMLSAAWAYATYASTNNVWTTSPWILFTITTNQTLWDLVNIVDVTLGVSGLGSAAFDDVELYQYTGTPPTDTPVMNQLTIATAVGGTTNPSAGTYDYSSTSSVSVTATPNTGYYFVSWDLGGTTYYTNPLNIPMTQDWTLTPLFSTNQPPPPPTGETNTLVLNSATGGTTTPAAGSYDYDDTSSVAIQASPQTGYVFDYWLLDGNIITNNPITIDMNIDHTLTPVFAVDDGGGGNGNDQNPLQLSEFGYMSVLSGVAFVGIGFYLRRR